MAASVWKGRIVFGLVSIPVRIYRAAHREQVRFHHVYRPEDLPGAEQAAAANGSTNVRAFPGGANPAPQQERGPDRVARVHNVPVTESADMRVPKDKILKGYQITPERYVVLTPSELAAMRPRTSTELEIANFVRLNDIDPVFFDAAYYVHPDKGGEKGYALLYRAMADSGYVAVGALAMHGREHVVVIRPNASGLMLHTLFFANEVSKPEAAVDNSLVSDKELDLAKMLVNAGTAPFDPAKLKDTFKEKILRVIESRAETAVPSTRNESPKRAAVVDMVDALRRSLDAVRKPAQSEETAPATPKKNSRRGRQ